MKRHCSKKNSNLRTFDVLVCQWIDISIDFVTGVLTIKQGNDMIMVVVDRFSKHAHFISINKNYGSIGVIKASFRYVFCYHGFSQTIVLDRDICFASAYYKEFTEGLRIKSLRSSTNYSQTDSRMKGITKTLSWHLWTLY